MKVRVLSLIKKNIILKEKNWQEKNFAQHYGVQSNPNMGSTETEQNDKYQSD